MFNAALSTYRAGPVPNETMEISPDELPAYAEQLSEAYRSTRINEYIVDFADRVDDRPLTGTMMTSINGKTLRIEVHGTDASGSPYTNLFVYDRR